MEVESVESGVGIGSLFEVVLLGLGVAEDGLLLLIDVIQGLIMKEDRWVVLVSAPLLVDKIMVWGVFHSVE